MPESHDVLPIRSPCSRWDTATWGSSSWVLGAPGDEPGQVLLFLPTLFFDFYVARPSAMSSAIFFLALYFKLKYQSTPFFWNKTSTGSNWPIPLFVKLPSCWAREWNYLRLIIILLYQTLLLKQSFYCESTGEATFNTSSKVVVNDVSLVPKLFKPTRTGQAKVLRRYFFGGQKPLAQPDWHVTCYRRAILVIFIRPWTLPRLRTWLDWQLS